MAERTVPETGTNGGRSNGHLEEKVIEEWRNAAYNCFSSGHKFCREVCPVMQVTRDERHTPTAFHANVVAMDEGHLTIEDVAEDYVHCTMCGACELRFELSRDGRPLVLERTRVRAEGALAAAPWGLAGRPVFGMAIASPAPDESTDDELRAFADEVPAGELASVTRVDGALVARYVGEDAERARAFFCRLWAAMRPDLIGAPAVPPRIWAT